MKKKMKIYEQPTVKVVRFMVEQGFAGSGPGMTGEGSGDDGEEGLDAPIVSGGITAERSGGFFSTTKHF